LTKARRADHLDAEAVTDYAQTVESRGSSSKEQRPPSRVSLQTLIIASIASAAASFAASKIWGAGTLVSAAATPVIVALVSEFLRRPVQTVAKTAQKVPTVQTLPLRRRTFPAPGDSTRDQPDHAEAPATVTSEDDSGTTAHAEIGAGRRWRLAVVTGALAFAIVLAVFTVPDLLAGHSITGNGQPTTFFGAAHSTRPKSNSVTTVTTTRPANTVTKTTSASTTTKTTTTKTTSTASSSTTTTSTSTTAASTSAPTTGASATATTTPAP
jgi:hypothetical protein